MQEALARKTADGKTGESRLPAGLDLEQPDVDQFYPVGGLVCCAFGPTSASVGGAAVGQPVRQPPSAASW
jgi:hypothetical protein